MSSYSIQLLVAAVIVPSTLFLTQHEVLLTLSNISIKLCYLGILLALQPVISKDTAKQFLSNYKCFLAKTACIWHKSNDSMNLPCISKKNILSKIAGCNLC